MWKHIVPLLFIFIFINTIKSQPQRLALVIGNENYLNGLPLYNPIHDANSMELALQEAGFEVYKYIDLDGESLKSAIDQFGSKLRAFDVGLFFYAGHGIQYQGLNYLIPIDASLKSQEDIKTECVEAQRVLMQMENANISTNIVILDACRNNPFARTWSRATASEGLAFMNAPSGSIIAYSTSPGKTASDGSGDNGLYTSMLLQYMKFPDLKIEDVFKRVRSAVREKSKGEQIPWENTSLEGEFYFFMGDEVDVTNSYVQKSKPKKEKHVLVDLRDGQEYAWVQMGDQVWMAQNMNLELENSWCYGNSSRNCSLYGRLYNWEAAVQVCPEGWHLPSDQEWKDLEVFLGMNKTQVNERYFRGEHEADRLKSRGTEHWIETKSGIVDEYGFLALPAGDRDPTGICRDLGTATSFWTATPYTDRSAWCRILYVDKTQIFRFYAPGVVGYSVRCIQDNN